MTNDDMQDGDNRQPAGAESGLGTGMRPETAEFLNDLAGIGTGAYLDMTQAESPEYADWRDGNFASDSSGNYVSGEGQTYADDDLQRMHNVLSQEAGNPLISQLFDNPKSPWANYLTWKNQNYDNKSAVGGAWEDEDGTLYSEPALQEMFGMKFATQPSMLAQAVGNAPNGGSTQQTPPCNVYVYEVLKESGAEARVAARKNWPMPVAAEWANPKFKIRNWRVLARPN